MKKAQDLCPVQRLMIGIGIKKMRRKFKMANNSYQRKPPWYLKGREEKVVEQLEDLLTTTSLTKPTWINRGRVNGGPAYAHKPRIHIILKGKLVQDQSLRP